MILTYFNIVRFLVFVSGIVIALCMTNAMAIDKDSMKLKVVKPINENTPVINKYNFPAKVTGPTLNASCNDVQMEEITVSHEGLGLEKGEIASGSTSTHK